jgi:hypothetical protein
MVYPQKNSVLDARTRKNNIVAVYFLHYVRDGDVRKHYFTTY